MESQGSRVLRSDNRRRQSKNGERKGSGSDRMASAKECKGCTEVFRTSKLLQTVCQRFAKIARPLHKITRKENKWNWEERQQKSFEELKERFTTEPVLVTPDLDKEMRVEVDVSDFAMGGVLSMKCEDGRWRPVAYISKSLNEAKRNYEIHDKEMLAIIQYLEI